MALAGVLSLGIVGCGSSSSDSSSGDSGLSFPSNAVSSAPTLENGQKVKESVATDPTSTLSALNSVDQSSGVNLALVGAQLSTTVQSVTQDINLQTYALNEVIDQTSACSGGGSIHVKGSSDNQTSATATVDFNSCVEGSLTMNGSLVETIVISNGDLSKLDLKFTTDFTQSSASSTLSITSGSYLNFEMKDSTHGKMTTSMIATDGTQKYGMKDAVYYLDFTSNTSIYQTQGRIYINNLASYVDYDTSYDMSQTPFVYTSTGLQSGEAHYIMANNGKVKIIAQSGVSTTYVDADNDGTYELSDASAE